MNDSQLISLAITLIAIFGGVLFNNSRIGDINSQMSARFTEISKRIDDMRDLLRAEMAALRSELKGDNIGLRAELKGEIGSLRSEVKQNIAGLRSEVKPDIAGLRLDVTSLRTLAEQNHQTTQTSLADIDARVSRLEQRAA